MFDIELDLNNPFIKQIVALAIAEDIGDGDHSSFGSIPTGTNGKARLLVKDSGILCGIDLAKYILLQIDANCHFKSFLKDGQSISVGDVAFEIEGSVHSILQAERLMLNFMQRLSGVATYTNKLVNMISGTKATLIDTRKTTPGLRVLEKYAVLAGGGGNHRMGLYDMVMLKDNHVDYAGGITNAVEKTVQYLKEKKLNLPIEVETRNLSEVAEALKTGKVNRIMFDNFSVNLMCDAVKMVDGQVETEASGGINEHTIRAYAETGVNFISVGALTHSVNGLDMSLKEF
jgi:nicotinate-nucleotide pyrophosphorylase (carboxylating)